MHTTDAMAMAIWIRAAVFSALCGRELSLFTWSRKEYSAANGGGSDIAELEEMRTGWSVRLRYLLPVSVNSVKKAALASGTSEEVE